MQTMSADLFINNRRALAEQLSRPGLVVLAGHGEQQRSNDMAYDFEQEANFWYLCGIDAADWQLLIDTEHGLSSLVAPVLSSSRQIFDGELTADAAQAISGVDEVIDRTELERRLDAAKGRTVYSLAADKRLAEYVEFSFNPNPTRLFRQLKKRFGDVDDCRRSIEKLRTIKSVAEIAAIEQAIAVTNQAFASVVDRLADYDFEYQVEADMTATIRRTGAKGHAYSPIVASGLAATTLHYTANQAPLHADQLLLIDVGARGAGGYAADITRTYGLKPTDRQKQVHQAVLQAQQECIDLLKPGLSFKDMQSQTDAVMRRTVQQLGLPVGKWRDYFPHAIGHGLGIDVHDSLTGYDSLMPGMVLTIEPGIYITEESIGVRIEDDILITDSGSRNLSAELSRQLDGSDGV